MLFALSICAARRHSHRCGGAQGLPLHPPWRRTTNSLAVYAEKVRIAYCTNVRLPSERAHGHQVAHVCDALAALGHDVTIFAPYRENVVQDDYWTYYGARRGVKLRYLGSFDSIKNRWLPGVIGLWFLNWRLRKELRNILRSRRDTSLRPTDRAGKDTRAIDTMFDLLYTRSPALLATLIASGIPTILELHQLPRLRRRHFVRECNRCARVVCLTSPIRDALALWGADPAKLAIEGDAVDLRRFEKMPDASAARSMLESISRFPFHVSHSRLVVGYVGRLKTLGMEKGVGILLQALKQLQPTSRFVGLVVGGPESDRREYERLGLGLGLGLGDDVVFTGEIPAVDVPTAIAACDVLVMPFPDYPHYRFHMSPLKMFEYMASGRPIITSDLPTVRDVLSEREAIFCKPGDVQSFSDALEWLAAHPDEAAARAQAARELVKRHTWEERMKRILALVQLGA